MSKNLLVVVLVILVGAFWWFSYRPQAIKKACFESVPEKDNQAFKAKIDTQYDLCLMKRGLK